MRSMTLAWRRWQRSGRSLLRAFAWSTKEIEGCHFTAWRSWTRTPYSCTISTETVFDNILSSRTGNCMTIGYPMIMTTFWYLERKTTTVWNSMIAYYVYELKQQPFLMYENTPKLLNHARVSYNSSFSRSVHKTPALATALDPEWLIWPVGTRW